MADCQVPDMPSGPRDRNEHFCRLLQCDPNVVFEPSALPSPFPPPSRAFQDDLWADESTPLSTTPDKQIHAVTWNVGAVNINPFEFWVTHPDPEYNQVMERVQDFVDHPDDRDVEIHKIFSEAQFSELLDDMKEANIESFGCVEERWRKDFRNRRAITEFLRDGDIGKKRLASMPDRITNTINCLDKGAVRRPTPISNFEGDLGSNQSWWPQWRKFMFSTRVRLADSDRHQVVCKLLDPILSSKYPAISPEEAAISIPLQILCLAIFDAILVHILNCVAPESWQQIRKSIGDALVKNKDDLTSVILNETYGSADVIFLQEAADSFCSKVPGSGAKNFLASKFVALAPANMESKRDQNSIILASRKFFLEDSAVDITEEVLSMTDKLHLKCSKKAYMHGDLVAYTIDTKTMGSYVLASFHGDTNGLTSSPIVEAVHVAARTWYPHHRVILGLDANTKRVHNEKSQGVSEFQGFLTTKGMSSCWGEHPDPVSPTTCSARTYLQPQMNKAISRQDRISASDRNLKDWILFYSDQMQASGTTKDNTGKKQFIEDMVFPTISFPSDHAVVATILTVKEHKPLINGMRRWMKQGREKHSEANEMLTTPAPHLFNASAPQLLSKPTQAEARSVSDGVVFRV